jgi:hypothetical protein
VAVARGLVFEDVVGVPHFGRVAVRCRNHALGAHGDIVAPRVGKRR